MQLWELFLKGSEFLVGNTFTLADIVLFPQLAYLVRLHFDLSKYRALSGYYERLKERPCFKETWPPHWLDGPGLPILAKPDLSEGDDL